MAERQKRKHFLLAQSVFASIVIASAFLILVFTHLILTREAFRTSEHQIRETKVALLVTKEILESKLSTNANLDQNELAEILEKLTSEIEVFDHPLLLEKSGALIYPRDETNPNVEIDANRIREILLTHGLTGQWFKPLPSPNQKDSLDIYTPLFEPNGVRYILKVSVTLDSLRNAFQRIYRFVIVIFVMVVLFAAFLGYRMKKKILDPLKTLTDMTSEIRRGNLNQHVSIRTGDEIEDLSDSFNEMAEELSIMKNKAEDSNPLTHLPGNNVISAIINERLQTGAKIAVIHADLDRFKIYNDLYGIQRGDEVIKMTAEVLKESVREKGTQEDLVAHEGGDDFVLVTTPACVEAIAREIIRRFDLRKDNHYRAEDRSRGYILIPDRRDKKSDNTEKVGLPLMSISLAAVTNETRSYPNYVALAAILAGMKKKAKSIQGSSFAISR